MDIVEKKKHVEIDLETRKANSKREICQNCKSYTRYRDGERKEGSCYVDGKFVKYTSRKASKCEQFKILGNNILKEKYNIIAEKAEHNKDEQKA